MVLRGHHWLGPPAPSLSPRTFPGPPLHLPAGRSGAHLPPPRPRDQDHHTYHRHHSLLSMCPVLFWALWMPSVFPPQQPSGNGDHYSPSAQKGQRRFREAKSLPWNHSARKWQSWDFNPGSAVPLSLPPGSTPLSSTCVGQTLGERWGRRRSNTGK